MILILLKNHLLRCHLKYRKMVVNLIIGLAVVVQLESSQLNNLPLSCKPLRSNGNFYRLFRFSSLVFKFHLYK